MPRETAPRPTLDNWYGLRFDAVTGDWLGWDVDGVLGSVITPRPDVPGPGWDVQVNGKWLFADNKTAYALTGREVRGVIDALHLSYTAGHLDVTLVYLPLGGGRHWLVQLQVTQAESAEPVQIGGYRFHLPGVSLGSMDDCRVTVPGPWWPKTYVRPDTPLADLLARDLTFHGAPDAGFGLLTLTNPTENLTLTAYMNTSAPNGPTGYRPSLRGDGEAVTFTFRDDRAQWLGAGETVASGILSVRVLEAGTGAAIRQDYRNHLRRDLPLDSKTPDWVRDAVILEVMPTYFAGGFRGLAERLPFYAEIGFNCLYLMPHWPGEYNGYWPDDLYAVNPALGTPDDLRHLVQTAHENGMRLLFDMVIHGWGPASDVPGKRPELFVRDDEGTPLPHSTWKSITSDWAAPAYREYMCDLVRHDLREYQIDGYRVDAASFKGANWNRSLTYPAYRSGSDSVGLMRDMMAALRENKPDAVLLSEVFGPAFYSACNLAHDNQTEALTHFSEMLDRGEVTANDYRLHIANVYDCLPPGANRVFFTRNHDTSWFYHFPGHTARYFAFEAIHAFCGIPSVFAGDPGNTPTPDDDSATWERYRRLFALRASDPVFTQGNLSLRDIANDNPHVFVALRRSKGRAALLAVSLSDTLQIVTLTLPPDLLALGWHWQDTLNDTSAQAQVTEKSVTFHLTPFQTIFGLAPLR